MNCPVCDKPLLIVERKGIELDYCMECKGIWFDEGELELLLEEHHLDHNLPDIKEVKKAETGEDVRSCPRCLKDMDKIYLGDSPRVLIDRCPLGEGLWFDRGELGEVVGQHIDENDNPEQSIIEFVGETFGGNPNTNKQKH